MSTRYESPKERRERERREKQQRLIKLWQKQFPVGARVAVSGYYPSFKIVTDMHKQKVIVARPDNISFLRDKFGRVEAVAFASGIGLCITVNMDRRVKELGGIKRVSFKPDQLRVVRED
ncbi:hypothetical protein LLG46_02260 [bacterium]|nr:hypothetical protein [bacterium]